MELILFNYGFGHDASEWTPENANRTKSSALGLLAFFSGHLKVLISVRGHKM